MFKKFLVLLPILAVMICLFCTGTRATNDWTTNPYVIDATEDTNYGGQIQLLEWHPDSTTDVLDVQSESGNQLWYIGAGALGDYTGDYSSAILKQEFNPPRPTYDIDIKRIGEATSDCSGTLYIHLYKTRQ